MEKNLRTLVKAILLDCKKEEVDVVQGLAFVKIIARNCEENNPGITKSDFWNEILKFLKEMQNYDASLFKKANAIAGR